MRYPPKYGLIQIWFMYTEDISLLFSYTRYCGTSQASSRHRHLLVLHFPKCHCCPHTPPFVLAKTAYQHHGASQPGWRRAVPKPGQAFTSGKEELRHAALQAGAECFACKVDPHEGLLLLLYGLMFKIKPYCTVIVDMLR